jgi:SAM-dependent MidA family methyltransferase
MSADPLPSPSNEAALHSRALAAHIRAEIGAADGWIDFARYMDLALYAPGLGYYAAGAAKLGDAGDFVTAPELTPLFTATLARQIGPLLSETGGDLLELGGGSGRLACDLLVALEAMGNLPARYGIVEVSPDLRARQAHAIEALSAGLAGRVVWLDALPGHIEGVVLANEVLDALPVHLVGWDRDGLYERGVAAGVNGFVFEDRALSDGALRTRAQRLSVPPPYLSEINLRASALVDALARRLRRGALLFIDYGFGRSEYYHPQRNRGTLMCHYRHRAHDDPFFLPGLQDITAHVDFTAVAEAGVACGLQLMGYATQARFLIQLGITDLLEGMQPGTRDYFRQAAAAQKLLSPAEMGELFKVIALGRSVSPLAGFAAGDLSRLL